MPYVPNIQNYKPFYIQEEDGDTAFDTRDYGLVAKAQPYQDNIEVKEPYKNDWYDENGDDEYVEEVYYKPIEFDVKFYIETRSTNSDSAISILNSQKQAFRNRIKSGYLFFYDSWQEIGFRSVRYVKDSVDMRSISGNSAKMIFTVTFKINDPVTRVEYDEGDNAIYIINNNNS